MSSRPSTAERIEIAGVITPSPIRRETPIKPRNVTNAILRPDLILLVRISFNTIVPPSPLELRLIARIAYSNVTRMIRVQNIRESIPIILS